MISLEGISKLLGKESDGLFVKPVHQLESIK